MKMRKEQQQVLMLGVILAIIVGVLLYAFGSHFLPSPQGVLVVPATPERLLLPTPNDDGKLYERDDFRSLREVPSVPIRPMPTGGTSDPFDAPDTPASATL